VEEDEDVLQRQDADEEVEEDEAVQLQADGEESQDDEPLQRQALDEDEDEEVPVQAKPVEGAAPRVNAGMESRIRGLKGGGVPLPVGTRDYFEPRLGLDLESVRVHDSAAAQEMAADLKARAFTRGTDIVFGVGQYCPETERGRHLLAHELTHVVQQGKAQRLSTDGIADRSGMSVASQAPEMVARAVDFAAIRTDIESGGKPGIPSALQNKGVQSGKVGEGANWPSKFIGRKRKWLTADNGSVPTDPSLSIEAFFFPSPIQHTTHRALIIGGIHGTEVSSYQIAEEMINILKTPAGAKTLYFHTLIIPKVNPGGVLDICRCNRQEVDLNRNFLAPAISTSICKIPGWRKRNRKNSTNCLCTRPKRNVAPEQPETKLIKKVVTEFMPDRILSLHAISNVKQAGIFADPATDPESIKLARSLAETLPENVRKGNLGLKVTYTGGSTGGTSLGAWAPTVIKGQTTPVITMEVPGYSLLKRRSKGFKGARSLEIFLTTSLGFVQDPKSLMNPEDRAILKEVDNLSSSDLKMYLTGRESPQTKKLAKRIEKRILSRVKDLNLYLNRYLKDEKARLKKLPKPTKIAGLKKLKKLTPIIPISRLRFFGTSVKGRRKLTTGPKAGQGGIIFDKFFMTGSKKNGWDSLPQKYWIDKRKPYGPCSITNIRERKKKCKVDKVMWSAEKTSEKLRILLEYSALPGTSRHHWGTDMDFNSTNDADWKPGGKYHELGEWLKLHAHKAGFSWVYEGKTGGYKAEPWHWTYVPLAKPILEKYRSDVDTMQDLIAPIVQYFQTRAKVLNLTVPVDFESELKKINILSYMTTIRKGL